jgi:hypothetical protein
MSASLSTVGTYSTIPQSEIAAVSKEIASRIPSLAEWTWKTTKPVEEDEQGELTYTCNLDDQYKVGPNDEDVVSLACTVRVPPSEASEASKSEPMQAQFEIYPVSKSNSVANRSLESIKYYAALVNLPVKYTGLASWEESSDFEGPRNDKAIKAAARECIEEMLTEGSAYRARIASMMPKEIPKKRRNRPRNARGGKRSGNAMQQ